MPERDHFIDNVRGLSMLIVIVTHALVPYLSRPHILTLWDRIHFAVPMLVFCSGYMLFRQKPASGTIKHISKRVSRLLGPYYLYAFAYITTAVALGKLQLSPLYILQSFSFMGGVDVSWFVLLFIYLAIISPVLLYLLSKRTILFHITAAISLISAILLLFKTPSMNYRWYMWIPWLFPYMFGYYYRIIKQSHRLLLLILMPIVFVLAYTARDAAGMPLSIISNKYPPTLYYLSYGLTALMVISYTQKTVVFTHQVMKPIWNFLSVHSYTLFFIHYYLLFLLDAFGIHRSMPPYLYIIVVIGITVSLQMIGNSITSPAWFLSTVTRKRI